MLEVVYRTYHETDTLLSNGGRLMLQMMSTYCGLRLCISRGRHPVARCHIYKYAQNYTERRMTAALLHLEKKKIYVQAFFLASRNEHPKKKNSKKTMPMEFSNQ